jgi:hypothetical protein
MCGVRGSNIRTSENFLANLERKYFAVCLSTRRLISRTPAFCSRRIKRSTTHWPNISKHATETVQSRPFPVRDGTPEFGSDGQFPTMRIAVSSTVAPLANLDVSPLKDVGFKRESGCILPPHGDCPDFLN